MKHRKILHWDDERRQGDGFIVTTAYGWAFEPDDDADVAQHIKGFDKASEARAELKWIRPCRCLRCQLKGQNRIGTAAGVAPVDSDAPY